MVAVAKLLEAILAGGLVLVMIVDIWRRHRAEAPPKRAQRELAARDRERNRQEAIRLAAEARAKRREQHRLLMKRYGHIVPISVGIGILAAAVCAIATHQTYASWNYAQQLSEQGYPPLWLWAGVGAALVSAGVLYARRG
jgi:hypothetical protein